MRKFGNRYYNRLNNRPIQTFRAKAAAELLRRNGFNARVIPASKGSIRGSRIFFKKKDDPGFATLPDSPFQGAISSGRGIRSGMTPNIPDKVQSKKDEYVDTITESFADGTVSYDFEYLEYLSPFEKDMRTKFGANSLYSLERKVSEGSVDIDDIRKLFESYSLDQLEEIVDQSEEYNQYKTTQEVVQNIYSPLVEMALDWEDPGKYAGKSKPKPITSDEFHDLAFKSSNWRNSKFREFSKQQKSSGRFGEMRSDNLEYFANADLDLSEFFDDGNSLLIPMKAIFAINEDGGRTLEKMKFDTESAYQMLKEFRDGQGNLREQELLKLELEFFQRMGGSVSDIDGEFGEAVGGYTGSKFTFLDYAEQQADLEEDYFYNLQYDIPGNTEYWEIKNVYGVISDDSGYYDPKLTAYFEPGPGDAGVFDRMPTYLKYYHDPQFRRPLDIDGTGEFGIDSMENPFTGETEYDPEWISGGSGWMPGRDGKPLLDREVREWPLQGTQTVMWRDHVVLNDPYAMFSERTRTALQALFPRGTSRAIGIQDIVDKIKFDGWSGDPMVVLSYLTGNGVRQITDEEFKELREFGVVAKYGDPNNIFGKTGRTKLSTANITDMDTPNFYWSVKDLEEWSVWDDIFD